MIKSYLATALTFATYTLFRIIVMIVGLVLLAVPLAIPVAAFLGFGPWGLLALPFLVLYYWTFTPGLICTLCGFFGIFAIA